MNYLFVNNQGTIRKIGFPVGSDISSVRRAIQDAYELPLHVKFSCVDGTRRVLDYRDILEGKLKSIDIRYDEIEEDHLITSAEKTLFDILRPTSGANNQAGTYISNEKAEYLDEETPLLAGRSSSRRHNDVKRQDISMHAEKDSDVVISDSDFVGSSYQNQLIKFERILAHLVNERTVLAWFRTNLAFVTLSLKYLKLGNVYIGSEYVAALVLFICGGIFMVLLPFSWYSGYNRFYKCKQMIDYNIQQLGDYLHKMGFDFDNASLAVIIFSSFFGIIFSSTLIIWTSSPSDDYSPL